MILRTYTNKNANIYWKILEKYILEHSVTKWRGFLPPIVEYEVNVRNIGDTFEKEFLNLLKTGHRDQYQNISVFQTVKS